MGAGRPEATPEGIRILAAAHERRLMLSDDDRWVVLGAAEPPIDQLVVARLARRGMIEIGSNPGGSWGYHTTRLGDGALRSHSASRRGVPSRR